ncbi:MAG: hypothetical protein N4A61_06850 [Pelagimonas sp.]|jgi:hypothetical protein|nr:hypothetical protein [Pelagimonas sp.]
MAIVAILVCSVIGMLGALYGLIIGDFTLLGAFAFYLVASLGCGFLCAVSYVQRLRTPEDDHAPAAQAAKA